MEVEMNEKIVVLGGGNGALAFAVYLALNGERVCLWEFPEFRKGLQWIYQNQHIQATGKIQGEADVTCYEDLREALQGAKLVMAVVPAFAHRKLAGEIARFLEEDSILVLNPGRTGGALEVASVLGQRVESISVVEAQTLLFACRKQGEKSVHFNGIKDSVRAGIFPANRTERVMTRLNKVLPQFRSVPDVLTTSLGNIGAVFHPASAILNAGMIESGRTYDYYRETMTPAVTKVIQEVDRERIALVKAAGAEVFSAQQWLQESYKIEEGSLYNMLLSNSAYQGIVGPTIIQTRYITEDIPTGLVPMEAFAQFYGVLTPTISALVSLANSLIGEDFRISGRNLSRLGLAEVTPSKMKSYVHEGLK
jgi:opine dehydrogenase